MRIIYSLGVLLSAALSMQAAPVVDFDYSYVKPGEELASPFGVGKKDIYYDVAMKIQASALVGSQIVGISVPLPATGGECYPEATAWLASELAENFDSENKFIPDIASKVGEIVNKGTDEEPDYQINISFDSPYNLTEEGVYVGYTVHVKDLKSWSQRYPVCTVASANTPESLWIHCSNAAGSYVKYLGWGNRYADENVSSAMTVRMRGERGEYSASISCQDIVCVETGKDTSIPVTIFNYGIKSFSSFDYTLYNTAGEVAASGNVTLPDPIGSYLGAQASAELTIPGAASESEEILKLAITSLDGNANSNVNGFAELQRLTLNHVPVRRPLIEELTGLWCKYCPEAYVKILQLKDIYEASIGVPVIAYHLNDRLQAIPYDDLPINGSAPTVYIDRLTRIYNLDQLQTYWEARAREICPADIKVDLYWTDDSHTLLRPQASVDFIFTDPEADYRIGYALIQDGITGPDYKQTNDPYGWQESEKEGPYWDLFMNSPEVSGLVFNDVAMALPEDKGFEGSLPNEPETGILYHHDIEMDPATCVCVYNASVAAGQPLVTDYNKLRVVAFLIDYNKNEIINSAVSGLSGDAEVFGTSGAELPGIEYTPILTEYFSLSGLRLNSAPAGEPYIVVNHYEDGKTVTAKKLQPLQ